MSAATKEPIWLFFTMIPLLDVFEIHKPANRMKLKSNSRSQLTSYPLLGSLECAASEPGIGSRGPAEWGGIGGPPFGPTKSWAATFAGSPELGGMGGPRLSASAGGKGGPGRPGCTPGGIGGAALKPPGGMGGVGRLWGGMGGPPTMLCGAIGPPIVSNSGSPPQPPPGTP